MEKEKDHLGAEFSFNYTWLEKIPTDVEEYVVPEGVERIRKGAAADCNKLRKIVLPSSLLSMENDEFSQIDTLQEVVVPEQWASVRHFYPSYLTCSAWVVEESAGSRKLLIAPRPKKDWQEPAGYPKFENETLKVPEGITIINTNAFMTTAGLGCQISKEIILPESLKQVENGAFFECVDVESIIFLSATPPVFHEESFLVNVNTPNEDENEELTDDAGALMSNGELGMEADIFFEGTILVPKGSSQAYKDALKNEKLHVEEWEKLE